MKPPTRRRTQNTQSKHENLEPLTVTKAIERKGNYPLDVRQIFHALEHMHGSRERKEIRKTYLWVV